MEMEKAFVDLVAHVFTLQWAIVALPLSVALSFLTRRVVPGLVLAVVAVVVHHVGLIAFPVLSSGGDAGAIPALLEAAIPKLEPLSLAAEYVAYAFLIVVFSLTRQDMFRPSTES